eukprot:c33064_g1_i1 orf=335-1540(-)
MGFLVLVILGGQLRFEHAGLYLVLLVTLSHILTCSRYATSVLGANEQAVQQGAAPSDEPQPASFVFGDSLVDAGNNDYLAKSLATARALPNGIDFPSPNARHPTGRFTNGLTIPDIVGQELGKPQFAVPVLAPTSRGSSLLYGVNYASGGAGILNDTGRVFRQLIPLDLQVSYFENTVVEIMQMLGEEKTKSFVAKSLFSITIGANDFLGNYIFPIPTSLEKAIPPQQFIQKLLNQYKAQLTRLYEAGARKLVVVNVPVIGCTPYLRSLNLNSNGACSSKANELAMAFNANLKIMLEQLNDQLPGAMLLYADAYGISSHIISNYEAYGFRNVDTACCGLVGSDKGIVPCRYPFVPMCANRGDYFFWDPYHPTQKAYRIIASELLDGTNFISPINIRQLQAL